MIKTFYCKETEKIYYGEKSKKFPPNIQRTALRKLTIIDNAQDLRDIKLLPGNHYEELEQFDGKSSIYINDQFRVCFYWKDKDAYDVEIIDYH